MTTLGYLTGLLPTLFLVLVPLAAAVLVGTLTRGRVRVLGIIGFALFVVEAVLGGVWLLVAPRLVRDTDISIAVVSGVYSVLRSVLALAGLALLAFALVGAARRPSEPDRYAYPGTP